jgi:recombination protein RecT
MTTQAPTQTTTPPQAAANGTAIEKRQPTRMDVLVKLFQDWRPTLRAILPKHIDPERVVKVALKVFMDKPELARCTPLSMLKATLQCAELGLDPSPLLGEAYFIPFNNKVKFKDGNVWKERTEEQVQLMPGYPGLIKLAKQTGDIADVYAVVVDECEAAPEYFRVRRGTVNEIHHDMRMTERTGNLFAVYGVVKYRDNTYHFEVLPKADVDAIRKRSKSADNGPWVTDYFAMARKTAIKQALKTVPKSPEKPALPRALAIDTAAELGEAFRGDLLSDTIDAEGTDVTDAPALADKPATRTEELQQRLAGGVKHDKDGVLP